MTVYADVLAVTNLYVDFFLLWCVRRSLHLRVRNRRLALFKYIAFPSFLSAVLFLLV